MSAIQAREHADASIGVFVVSIGDAASEESATFRQICSQAGVEFIDGDPAVMQGLHPMYARLFLDLFLPSDVEEILYLDGDTQILGDLDPLVHAAAPLDGILASRDPMVFIRELDRRLADRIDGWWDKSSIPAHLRRDYINSGVFRVSRDVLPKMRERCLELIAEGRDESLQFRDQDAINLALDGRVDTLSMSWNYPGFLLGTQMVDLVPPRIVHFMSNPRPWNAPFRPWGDQFFLPYSDFVDRFPAARPYWKQLGGVQRYRYVVQQWFKRVTERRLWESKAAATAVRELNDRDRVL